MAEPGDLIERLSGVRFPLPIVPQMFFQHALRELRNEQIEQFMVGKFGQEFYQQMIAALKIFAG